MQAGQRQFGDRQQKDLTLHYPRLAPIHAQAEVLGGGRCVKTKGDEVAVGQRHPAHPSIATIQHLHARRALGTSKDSCLGRGVLVEIDVAIEMIIGDVEDRGRRRIQGLRGLQLKTGKLQHPDPRQGIGVLRIHKGRQGRRGNIAGDADGLARGAQQMPRQCGGGGLAIGAGDRQHRHGTKATQRLGEQLDLADHRNAGGARVNHHHQTTRQSRRKNQQIDAVEQHLVELAGSKVGTGGTATQLGQIGRCRSRVGHAHLSPLPRAPERTGQARFTEAENENVFAVQIHGKFSPQRRRGAEESQRTAKTTAQDCFSLRRLSLRLCASAVNALVFIVSSASTTRTARAGW